jgi:hypothetical protein
MVAVPLAWCGRGAVMWIITVLSACAGGTVGLQSSEVTGVYALEKVDGMRLPVSTSTGACPMAVSDGQVSIVPKEGETQPLYVLLVFARPSCESFQDAPAPREFVRDFGDWRWDTGRLVFTSRNGRVTYVGRADVAEDSPVLTLGLDGRNYVWRRARQHNERMLPFSVLVVDAAGRPVDGAYLEIRGANGLVSRGVTNAGRPFLTGASSGRATIRVAAPSGYELAAGQEHPLTVVPMAEGETAVRIVVAKNVRHPP